MTLDESLSTGFAALSPILAPLADVLVTHGHPDTMHAFYALEPDELAAFLAEPELASVTKLQRIVLTARHAAGRATSSSS